MRLVSELEDWLKPKTPGFSLEALARGHIDVLSEWLEEYLIVMYLRGKSRRAAAETLNGLSPNLWLAEVLACRALGSHKDVEGLEPVPHHLPMPAQVVHAVVGTALCWQWHRMAVLLVLGFFGLLKPAELVGLRRQDPFFQAITSRAMCSKVGWAAENSTPRRQLSTCVAGREQRSQLGGDDAWLHTAVAEDLEWFMVGVLTPI